MMKNAFYFILKALLIFEIFTFLSRLFGYVGKRLHNKANVNFKIHDVTQAAIICSKLTTETLEQGVKYVQMFRRRSGVFIVNFEHISHLVLVFLLLTLSR